MLFRTISIAFRLLTKLNLIFKTCSINCVNPVIGYTFFLEAGGLEMIKQNKKDYKQSLKWNQMKLACSLRRKSSSQGYTLIFMKG